MVGIALLGAGIFAREQHLPAIEGCSSLELKAIYSRSESSARSLAAATRSPDSVEAYFADPLPPQGKSLGDLLARPDIGAVAVCLPITTQPDVIRTALLAGKHVLSEKPVGKDVATARELVAWYDTEKKARGENDWPIWSVAENFRFTENLRVAAEKLAGLGGTLTTFRLSQYAFVKADNKYYNTEWRKIPDYQGGFLLDAGVHYAAGLRRLLASVGQEITTVRALTTQLEKRLPPVDTLNAVVGTRDGHSGTVTISFATEFKSGLEIEVLTTNGSLCWSPKLVKVVRRGSGDDKQEELSEWAWDSGVKNEFQAFADSLVAKKADPLLSPQEALKDLEILEAMLVSGQGNGALVTIE